MQARGITGIIDATTTNSKPHSKHYSNMTSTIIKKFSRNGVMWRSLTPLLGSTTGSKFSTRSFQMDAPYGATDASGTIEEINFSPEVANSVSIFGNVGRKPEIKYFENGNKVASWGLAFQDRKRGDVQWFNIEAWGPLAELVTAELDKGSAIVVEGRLKIDTWTTRENEERKSIKIVANAVKKVRRDSFQEPSSSYGNSSGTPPPSPQSRYAQPTGMQSSGSQLKSSKQFMQDNNKDSSMPSPVETTEQYWMYYFENPSAWLDNRSRKSSGEINPKSPDFKMREGGRDAPALWIDSKTTPAWVRQELARQDGATLGGGEDGNFNPPF